MQAFNADVQDRILALVKAILEQNAIAAEVHPESRLVDVGLTSMDMVNLMLGVEAEFDFTIPQSEITPENFQSVKTLERMIVGSCSPSRRLEQAPDLSTVIEMTGADRSPDGAKPNPGFLRMYEVSRVALRFTLATLRLRAMTAKERHSLPTSLPYVRQLRIPFRPVRNMDHPDERRAL